MPKLIESFTLRVHFGQSSLSRQATHPIAEGSPLDWKWPSSPLLPPPVAVGPEGASGEFADQEPIQIKGGLKGSGSCAVRNASLDALSATSRQAAGVKGHQTPALKVRGDNPERERNLAMSEAATDQAS